MLKKLASKEMLIIGILVITNLCVYMKYVGEIDKFETKINKMTA
jgi:hypothetical protein